MYPKIVDFRDFISNAGEIRKEYGGVYSDRFYEKNYIANWRDYIYSRTNLSWKQRYMIWEYLNYDIGIEVLIDELIRHKTSLARRQKKWYNEIAFLLWMVKHIIVLII